MDGILRAGGINPTGNGYMRQRERRCKGPEAGARGAWEEESGAGKRPDATEPCRTSVLIQSEATLSKIPSGTIHNKQTFDKY